MMNNRKSEYAIYIKKTNATPANRTAVHNDRLRNATESEFCRRAEPVFRRRRRSVSSPRPIGCNQPISHTLSLRANSSFHDLFILRPSIRRLTECMAAISMLFSDGMVFSVLKTWSSIPGRSLCVLFCGRFAQSQDIVESVNTEHGRWPTRN